MRTKKLWPGLLLCSAVTLLACALESVEVLLFHRAWLESLVLAILLGSLIRTGASVPPSAEAGIHFGAHRLLETAMLLLGASVSAGAILDKGLTLIVGIAVLVAIAISISYFIGRAFGLSSRMALLIACGNSICGNSAIAAVAPAIEAEGKDVAASISGQLSMKFSAFCSEASSNEIRKPKRSIWARARLCEASPSSPG